MISRRRVSVLAAATLVTTVASIAQAGKGDTILVSRSSAGLAADDASFEPVSSANGRFVAFISRAENLSGADTADTSDIYVFDAKTRRVALISRRSRGGAGGAGASGDPAITPDGRYVVFRSSSDNFPGDGGIYLYDRRRQRLQLVSRNNSGDPASGSSYEPSVSADGRLIAFETDADNLAANDDDTDSDVYVYDRRRKRVRLVSRSNGAGVPGNDDSRQPRISANGRVIAFISSADNLSGADEDDSPDVFAYAVDRRRVSLVSRESGGGPGGDGFSQDGVAVSASGRLVAFGSDADNLSAADSDSAGDVFVYDLKRRRVALVSRESGGGPGGDLSSQDPTISATGRFVAFQSGARNFSGADLDAVSDVFAYDRDRNRVTLLSREANSGPGGDGTSGLPGISADGRFVAFSSNANNLPGDYSTSVQNIFRHDYRGR